MNHVDVASSPTTAPSSLPLGTLWVNTRSCCVPALPVKRNPLGMLIWAMSPSWPVVGPTCQGILGCSSFCDGCSWAVMRANASARTKAVNRNLHPWFNIIYPLSILFGVGALSHVSGRFGWKIVENIDRTGGLLQQTSVVFVLLPDHCSGTDLVSGFKLQQADALGLPAGF